jgi:excisionase family DNA binding protein
LNEKLLGVKEACKLLRIHPLTLRNWDAKGRIKTIRTKNGRRIPQSEVDRLLREDPFVVKKFHGPTPGIYKRVVFNLRGSEYEEMSIIKDFFFKNGVIQSNSDDAFAKYCLRHVMEEFKSILQGGYAEHESQK